MFPSSLIGTGENWTLMKSISVTEYLNYEAGPCSWEFNALALRLLSIFVFIFRKFSHGAGKFSKSKGVGVFGNDAKDSNIPSEVWRYYLLTNRPEVCYLLYPPLLHQLHSTCNL